MCDCYWTRCSVCKRESIPVHITNFDIPRDEIKIYCHRHFPRKNVVMHKLIEDEHFNDIEGRSTGKTEHKAGWIMGVRYLKKIPKECGYLTVTPNVCAEHIAKIITQSGKCYWTTEMAPHNYSTEANAVKNTTHAINSSSPTKKRWEKHLMLICNKDKLQKQNVPVNVYNKIRALSNYIIRRYKSIEAIILIGSYAEGTNRKDSDIDLVVISKTRISHGNLHALEESYDIRVQLIPYTVKALNYQFANSTTMAYSIQMGKIVYQKNNFMERYNRFPLRYPSNEWFKDWFKHWLQFYSFGVHDYKGSKRRNFDFVSDLLPRGTVNFAILFVESKGHIPVSKNELISCFQKEVSDSAIIKGLKIALASYHRDMELNLKKADNVYATGEFLKTELKRHVKFIEAREAKYRKLKLHK